MPENINDLYNKIDFLVKGGALQSLTAFLNERGIKALVVEAGVENTLNVIDAAGIVPESLTLKDEISRSFTQSIVKESFELEFSSETNAIRIRGSQWEIYILIKDKLADSKTLVQELKPYAGLIALWKTYTKISDTEKRLSRLSYMILATKSTLASIFEPMPLQYFASFLADVLQESLFPKSIAILKDEGNYLTVFNGKADSIPERKGIYAAQILPPTPVVTKNDKPVEIVLPVAEGDSRLFCLIQWDELPDDQTMNFLELLGNLAVRAIAINNLRQQSQQAEANISSGEFTVLSLSNVLKILRAAEDKAKFFSLLVDIFVEQCRMSNCLLASWNTARKGYMLSEQRTGNYKADINTMLLPSSSGAVLSDKVKESHYDLSKNSADAIFKSWGLGGCPWKDTFRSLSIRYVFPVCDDSALVGIIAIGDGQLNRSQLASLQLIAQFAAYEFRRFD